MISMLITLFCLGYEPAKVWADTRVRRVQVQSDQIVTIKTAIGIATIIQVPDRPNSIVVGDLSAFKVEYLDQAITIKPLHSGARSNLYVYTDYRGSGK
jgi:type IV secretory pathway VirB9-like protein